MSLDTWNWLTLSVLAFSSALLGATLGASAVALLVSGREPDAIERAALDGRPLHDTEDWSC